MGWKHARDSLKQSRQLSVEKEAVREIGERLKSEMNQFSVRMSRMNEDFRRIRAEWSKIESPSDVARKEFESQRKQIHESSKEILRFMTNGDDQFYAIVMEIEKTPKSKVDRMLTLTNSLQQICESKLENDVPLCKELVVLREQSVQRLAELANNEKRKQTLG